MKALSWINKNKFPLLATAFLIVAGILLYNFIQGMKKDHSIDLVMQELKIKEQARQDIISERQKWIEVIAKSNDNITQLIRNDSTLIARIAQNNKQAAQIQTQYHEKIKVVDHYNTNDLLQYYNALPEEPDNDY